MTWYAFHGYNNGKAIDIAGSQEKEATLLGFHGYGSEAQAERNPNSVNFLNSLFVRSIIADYQAALKEGAQPGGPNANILNPGTAVSAGASYLKNSIPGLGTIDDLINWVRQPALWTRVGEVLAGVILLYIGLKAVTTPGNAPVVQRTVKDTAKTVTSRVVRK